MKTMCMLLITNPKSKSQRNMTKYQFEHMKQLKKSQAKHAPQHICKAIKNPKLKPTPYILSKQPDVIRPFLLSPLLFDIYCIYIHTSKPPPSPPLSLAPLLPPLPCSSFRFPPSELFLLTPPNLSRLPSMKFPPFPSSLSLFPLPVFPFPNPPFKTPSGPKASPLPQLFSSSFSLCPLSLPLLPLTSPHLPLPSPSFSIWSRCPPSPPPFV